MSLKGNLRIWRAHEGHPTWDVFARTLTMFSDDYISMPQCPLLPPYIWYARHVERVARVEGVSIRKRTLAWRRAHPEMAMGSLEIDWELCFFYRFQFSPVWFTCYLFAYFCFLICSWLHLWSWRCQAVFHGGKVLAVKLFAEFVLRTSHPSPNHLPWPPLCQERSPMFKDCSWNSHDLDELDLSSAKVVHSASLPGSKVNFFEKKSDEWF